MIVYQVFNNKTNRVVESKLVLTWDTAVRKCLEFIPNKILTKEQVNDLYENGCTKHNYLTMTIFKLPKEVSNEQKDS